MLRRVYSRTSCLSHLALKTQSRAGSIRYSSNNVVISFKKVSFGYTDEKLLLNEVDFNIRDGE